MNAYERGVIEGLRTRKAQGQGNAADAKGKGKGNAADAKGKGKGKTQKGAGGKSAGTDAADKGSGKGKGSGKDSSRRQGSLLRVAFREPARVQGQGKGSEGWSCPSNLCKIHEGGQAKWNAASRNTCSVCLTPKPKKEVDREEKLTKLREETEKLEKKKAEDDKSLKKEDEERKKKENEKKRKKEADDKKKKDAEASKASPAAPTEGAMAVDATPTPLEDLIMPKEFQDLQKRMFWPKPLDGPWSVTEAIKDFLPNLAGRAVVQIQEEIDTTQAILALEGKSSLEDHGYFAAHKKHLAALEKELAKAEKETPTTSVDLASLRLAKEKFAELEKKKDAGSQKGAQAELERVQRLRDICQEKIDAWRAALDTVLEEQSEREATWTSRRSVAAQRRAEVDQLFDSKIQAAEAAKSAEDPVEVSPATPALQVVAAVVPQLQKSLEQIMTEQLMYCMPFRQEDVADVKALGDIKPEHKNTLTRMHAWMVESTKGDQLIPFSFSDMCTTVQAAQSLVGETVWNSVFPNVTVLDTNVCPFHLRQLVFAQLTKLSEHLTVSKQVASEVKTSFEAASAAWVKRKPRCSPYGA